MTTMNRGRALAGVGLLVLALGCGHDKPAESPAAEPDGDTTGGPDADTTGGPDADTTGGPDADTAGGPDDGSTSLLDGGATGGADGAPGSDAVAPGALCVDDQPALAAAVPSVQGTCAGGQPASTADPSRPLGFGLPGGSDALPAGVAYLTFDDGPSDWTGEILDTLAAKGVHATFFVTAKQLKGPAGLDATYTDAAGNQAVYRDLVKREAAEGHVIGNHTVDHKDLSTLADADAAAELDLNEQLINQALIKTGGAPRVLGLVRPPYGSPWVHSPVLPTDKLATAGRVIANRGIDVLWTLDSTDSREWAQGETYRRDAIPVGVVTTLSYADKVARVQSSVLNDPSIAAHAGAIILMHDSHNGTRDALGAIIDGLRAAGYTFGTIEELVQQRYGRPSVALTPGPALFAACVPEAQWGCDGPAGADAAHSVCGRLWRAYESAGGAAKLGAPLGAPATDATTGAISQPFEHGALALHPERVAPCTEMVTASP
jgi:peptidoglycan/xylan/chitin deacetylase (PgdA/CDA1 family)